MQIEEIEYTPNPNAVKFIVDEQLTSPVGGVTKSFESEEAAADVPLADEIMALDHVISVFFASNYITVTQDGDAEWEELMREVAEPIRDAALEDTRSDEGPAEASEEEGEDDEKVGMDDPRMPEIRDVIEEEILPYLQGDGGSLKIKGLVDDELHIEYEGACGSCPASITGTLMSIEHLLKREVDENLSVEAIGGLDDMAGPGGMGGPPMGF